MLLHYIILLLIIINLFTIFHFTNKSYFLTNLYNKEIESLKEQLYQKNLILENLYSSDKIKTLVDVMSQKLITNYDREKKDLENRFINHNELFEKQIFDKVKSQFNDVKNDLNKHSSMLLLLNKDVASAHEVRQMLFHPQQSGKLSEISLANILSNSGLVENIDYNLQYTIKTWEGDIYRPDAIVFLPNKSTIIIDAKASTFFMDGKKSAKLIKDQIRDLKKKFYSEKVYDMNYEFSSIVTLLYIPSDSLLERLYKEDPSIIKNANESNIFIVGPISLIHMISLARISIYNNNKAENFEKIFFELDLLISNILISKKSILKIHNSIKNLNKDYDDFDKSFLNNVIYRAEKIKNNKFLDKK